MSIVYRAFVVQWAKRNQYSISAVQVNQAVSHLRKIDAQLAQHHLDYMTPREAGDRLFDWYVKLHTASIKAPNAARHHNLQ